MAVGHQDPSKLKDNFGGRIVFHGNTNNEQVFHGIDEELERIQARISGVR
jgi:hypothetical protein